MFAVFTRRRPAPVLLGAVLLAGTALSPAVAQTTASSGTVLALAPLKVSGQASQSPTGPGKGLVATRSAAGTKTNASLAEVPQTINVVTQAQISALGAQTVSQALRYTPGIADEIYGDDGRGDWLQIRGFNGYDSIYQDGLKTDNGAWVYQIEPYGLSRLEVLKGPASVVYGANEPGGMVDAQSKRPTATPHHEIQLTGGSYGRAQLNFDVGGPVAGTDGKLDVRLVGVFRKSGAQVAHTQDNRQYIAPSLTWHIDPDTELTILASYLRQRAPGWAGTYVPAAGSLNPNPNGQVKTSTFLGEPGFDHYNYNQTQIGYEFTHRFSDALKFNQDFRYSWLTGDEQLEYGSALEADGRTLDRALFKYNDSLHTLAQDSRMEANFDTGPVHHDVIAGLDFRHQVQDYKYWFGTGTPIDIFDPVYTGQTGTLTPSEFDIETLNQLGAYGQDEMSWRNWRLLGGVRHDWVSDNIQERLASASSDEESDATTYRVGLVYLFDNGLSPYVSYATSFEPVTGTDAQGAAFKPTQGKQEEMGVKYQPPGLNAFFSAALFNLTETNVATTDPENPLYSVQTGEDRNQGLELEAKATLTQGLDVDAAYTYSNTAIVKDNSGDVGNQMPLVPRHMISLWGHYTLQHGKLAGLGLGAGWRYHSTTYGDAANSYRLPPVSLFDLSADYDLGRADARLKGFKAQVNASNLGNVKYLAVCTGAVDCFWGPRRTVYATLSYDW